MKLQQMATRGSGVSGAEWDIACKAANKALSLLQPGSRTSIVAATFTSHATGKNGQHVFEIFEMDADDNCKHEKCGKKGRQVKMKIAQMKTRQKRKPQQEIL